mgnify:CR=1 FL=1
MKIIKFNDMAVVKNIKVSVSSIMRLINKTPSCPMLDEKRSISKTDVFVVDYTQKIYGVTFFEKVKSAVKEFGRLKNHSEIRISNYCFIKMKGKDQLDYHSSFESNFVGLFLLEAPEKNPSIIFYDNQTNKDINVKLKQGDLVMFPASVLRKLPELKTKKQYTYIIFDFHLDRPRINVKK